jgi:hypothetical protein
MLADKIKELAATKAHAAALELEISKSLNKTLAALPSQYGFDNLGSFIAAVRNASRGGKGRRAKKGAGKGGKPKRTRAKITDETRATVKKMVEDKKTGTEIAKAVGISLPSVQNIKKALGLVAKRKK